jgi:hypothetical protein
MYFLGGDKRMKKHVVVFSLLLSTIFCTAVQASIVEYPLDDPFQYVREIGPDLITHNSPVDIYVANVEAPERWKDWKIVIWVPLAEPDLTSILVDYSNDSHHAIGSELEVFPVTLAPYSGLTWEEQEYKGFYASTWLPRWEEFGTNPVGSGLPHAWGNPAWVSFHFDVGVDPVIYIKDACVPEPVTFVLLGLGAIVLRRRK